MKMKNLVTVGILGLCAAATMALSPSSRTIQNRKSVQQHRIAQGVKSGQLTPRETGHLEKREASINREEHGMRRADGGHLTPADRGALTQRQNRVSRSIYRDKHSGRTR